MPYRTTHATRVKIIAQVLELDFEKNTAQKALDATEPLALGNTVTGPIELHCSFAPGTSLPLIVTMGLQFMEQYEGFCYPLREREYNAMAIVPADSVGK